MITEIILDCDGVLFDWPQAMCKRFNVNPEHLERGEYKLENLLSITSNEMWSRIDNNDFWSSVKAYNGAEKFLADLYEAVALMNEEQEWAPITISYSTISSRNISAFSFNRLAAIESLLYRAGDIYSPLKIESLEFDLYISRKSKRLLGAERRILIDDNAVNCKQFMEIGGLSVLVDMPWNTKDLSASWSGPNYNKVLHDLTERIVRSNE